MSRTTLAEYRDLFDKRAFANLATIRYNGTARVTPVWCDLDGDAVILNTARGRHQDSDVRRDRRISLVIVDPENPYRYLEIRGHAVETSSQDADVHLDRMAKKYLGVDRVSVQAARRSAGGVLGTGRPHAWIRISSQPEWLSQ